MKAIYYVLLIIVIVIIYTLLTWHTCTYEDYLYGFWTAHGDKFCESSSIDSMLLFIGEADKSWNTTTRTCYLIITDDLCNQGLTLTYKPGWASVGLPKYRLTARPAFDSSDLWTDTVFIDVDMRDGTMLIHNDNIVYAKLTKQHDTTNAARLAENAELVD